MRYQIFKIDIEFRSYAIDYIYVGAKDIKDLESNYLKFLDSRRYDSDMICSIFNPENSRIEEISGMYTTEPYKILDRVSYIE